MISTDALINAVARVSRLPPKDLVGGPRYARAVVYRQAIMFVLRRKGGLSYERISYRLRLKCHSTSIHGVQAIETRLRDRCDVAVRAYRTVIRCYVQLEQQERRDNEAAKHAARERTAALREYAGLKPRPPRAVQTIVKALRYKEGTP